MTTTPFSQAAPRSDFFSAHRAALVLLGLLTVFRLLYAAQSGMAQDEMHYWTWSQHLDLSYYDQGPGIAWFIRTGTSLFGNTPLGVRLMTVLMAAGVGWLVYRTTERWTNRRTGLCALLLLSVAPLFAAGSILATYDGPQVFFWAAAWYAVTRTVQENKTAGWYAVGFLVGLGLLCKLTMLLFAPGVLLFLLLSPVHRRWLSTPHPWLAFVLALACAAPIVVWNAQHDWMGLLHTVSLGNKRVDAPPFRWFGDFLGGQAIALGPLLLLAELYALVRLALGLRKTALLSHWKISAEATHFFLAFAAPTLVLCLIVSLRSKLEINWPAPTHLAGLSAVAVWFVSAWETQGKAGRAWIALAVGLSAGMTFFAFFPGAPSLAGITLSEKLAEKLNETYGWDEIMPTVAAARTQLASEGKPVFVGGVNYRVNAALSFGLPDHPQPVALFFNSRRDQFFIWTRPDEFIGQNAVFCLDDKNDDAVDLARRYFASVEPLPPITVARRGFDGTVKKWYLYACRDFKGYNPSAHVEGY